MRAAFVLFDRLTALDFVGVYDPLTRLRSMELMPDFEWDLCGLAEQVTDDRGLCLQVDSVGQSLSAYDLLVVPGGLATRQLRSQAPFLDCLRTAAPVPLKASVCTGALLLGAAGFLAGLHVGLRGRAKILPFDCAMAKTIFRRYFGPDERDWDRRFDDVFTGELGLEMVHFIPETVVMRDQSYKPTQWAQQRKRV